MSKVSQVNMDRKYSDSEALSTFGKRSDLLAITVFGLIFYISAYFSVSGHLPTSIPVHHDDYTNYAAGGNPWTWSWIRPLSTLLIHALAQIGSDWLIWTIRLLTVTFVFLAWKLLCEFLRPVYYWQTLILFAVGSFSTPIIVEYARYTGMITHLLSGCLGLFASYLLFREVAQPKQGWLYLSVVFLVLSVLAKEDFVVLYFVFLAYTAVLSRPYCKRILTWGIAGLGVCVLVIVGAKFMAASSFLGTSDAMSPYYVDASAGGVLRTIWHYLVGAGHPAMLKHGLFVAGIFIFSVLATFLLLFRRRNIPKTTYFVAATLSVMLPYSVLPNHVNAYYEFIWLPMLIGGGYMALAELMAEFSLPSPKLKSISATVAFLLLVVALTTVDYSRRRGVAGWYDEVAKSNGKLIGLLLSQKDNINQAKDVCIAGANSFSPWYMHSGEYLGNVLGLHAKWHIAVDATSPLHAGMMVGVNSSKGQTVLVPGNERMPESCLQINLEQIK